MPSEMKKTPEVRITTPSEPDNALTKTPEPQDGAKGSSRRSRPSILASVGKMFSRSKRKSSKERMTSKLTPLETKYLSMTSTSSDRIVFAILEACHFPLDQVDLLI